VDKSLIRTALKQLKLRFTVSEISKAVIDLFTSTDHDIEKVFRSKYADPVVFATKQYVQLVEQVLLRTTGAVQARKRPVIDEKNYVSLKKLMAYLYKYPITDLTSLLRQLSAFRYNSEEFRLQTVDVAVNEGTTKNFVRAILTEMIQNSFDAIRLATSRSDSRGVTSDIHVTITSSSLAITDTVGIPDAGLIALLLPFLSTKDASVQEVTGEMGTGFFNVYRQPFTSYVVIDTICPMDGIPNSMMHTRIEAVPKVEAGRVTDVYYSIHRSSTTQSRGTTITVHFNEMDKHLIADSIVSADAFIHQFLAYVDGFNVYYNEQPVRKEKELVYTSNVLTVYHSDYAQTSRSVLMTNNVPFSDLESYYSVMTGKELMTMLKLNVVVNVSKNYYTPVHSRSSIMVGGSGSGREDKATKLLDELEYGLFLVLLQRYVKISKDRDAILSDTEYSSEVYQVIPYHHQRSPPSTLRSIKDVQRLISYLALMAIRKTKNDYDMKALVYDECQSILRRLRLSPEEQQILFYTVRIWFEKKTVRVEEEAKEDKKDKKDKEEKEDNETGQGAQRVSDVFQHFTAAFWECGRELEAEGVVYGMKGSVISFQQSAPRVWWKPIGASTLGYFDNGNNMLVLNSQRYFPNHIESMMLQIAGGKMSINNINFDSKLRGLLENNVSKVGTMLHELGHAYTVVSNTDREASVHDIPGAHAPRAARIGDEIKDGHEEDNRFLFDEMAAKVFNLCVVKKNFWGRFSAAITG
jgi:hypothetical protein